MGLVLHAGHVGHDREGAERERDDAGAVGLEGQADEVEHQARASDDFVGVGDVLRHGVIHFGLRAVLPGEVALQARLEFPDALEVLVEAGAVLSVGATLQALGLGEQQVEHAAAGGDAARALIYVQQAFAEEPATPRVPAGDIAALSLMEKNAKLTSTQAKTLLAELVANGGGDVLAMAKAKGFEAMATGALESIVDQAIAADPQAWAKYKAGEQKAIGALVGAVMKLSAGKADGKAVTALLQAKAAS